MGTIVGRGGTGVAPKATFITCRGCNTASCTEAALLKCGEFTTCPTQPDGSDEDCSKKPALSSNSWGGGQENSWYNDVVNAWRAADIVPIFAIGNSGPGCRSANSPGDQTGLISVGATTSTNTVASFSSHGPTLISARIKPEVSAPGQNVRSAGHTGDNVYVALSGTSMATPHVAGAVAVLLSKNNELSFDQIDTLLKENTLRPRLEQIICTGGGVNITNPWPNNSFGHGKIDLKLAADAAPSA
jgi:subtilisin family serine protease